jgi:hypothetical protein
MPEIISILGFTFMCGVCYIFSKMCTYANEPVNSTENDYIFISKADFENLQKKVFDAKGVAPGVTPPNDNQGVAPPYDNQGVAPPYDNQGVKPPAYEQGGSPSNDERGFD